MKLLTKITNCLLFGLAAFIPFIGTFKTNFLQYLIFTDLVYFLVVFYIVVLLLSQNKNAFPKSSKLTIAIILIFISYVLSGVFAADLDLALGKIIVELRFLIIYLVINRLILNKTSYTLIFNGLLVGFVISCIVAYLQSKQVAAFYLFTPEELNTNTGLIYEKVAKDTLIRIWGPFGNALTFSEYLAVVGAALYVYFRKIKKNTFLAVFIILLAAYTINLTVARTALFALGFSIVAVEFIDARVRKSKSVIVVLALTFVGLVLLVLLAPTDSGNPIFKRFFQSGQDFKEGRLNLWIKGFQAFSRNIFLGVGPGNLRLSLSQEGFPLTSDVIAQFDGQHVENYYLTQLYSLGIIGLYFCLSLYYYLIKYSYKLFINVKKNLYNEASFGGILLGAVIAIIINNITNPALIFDERIKMLFIFIIVIINNSNNLSNRLRTFVLTDEPIDNLTTPVVKTT